jgi:hypothetical protein
MPNYRLPQHIRLSFQVTIYWIRRQGFTKLDRPPVQVLVLGGGWPDFPWPSPALEGCSMGERYDAHTAAVGFVNVDGRRAL